MDATLPERLIGVIRRATLHRFRSNREGSLLGCGAPDKTHSFVFAAVCHLSAVRSVSVRDTAPLSICVLLPGSATGLAAVPV